jgi:predicted PurR-regulated permease PerM
MLGIDGDQARSALSSALVYGSIALTVAGVWVIRHTLLQFATAILLAYLLAPFVDEIDRRLGFKKRAAAVSLAARGTSDRDGRVENTRA